MNPSEDFVYSRDNNGEVMSGGYKINSILLKSNTPLFKSTHNVEGLVSDSQKGGNSLAVDKIFNDLAVPASLLFLQQKMSNSVQDHRSDNRNNIVEESLYDKLYKMVEVEEEKVKKINKTKKYIKKNRKNRKSRKNNF